MKIKMERKKGIFPRRDNYGPRIEKESASRLRRDI